MLQLSLAFNLDGQHCKQKHLNRSPRRIPDIVFTLSECTIRLEWID